MQFQSNSRNMDKSTEKETLGTERTYELPIINEGGCLLLVNNGLLQTNGTTSLLDSNGQKYFPLSVFSCQLSNTESMRLDWLLYSSANFACSCCQFFNPGNFVLSLKGIANWKKNPTYWVSQQSERSAGHKNCYPMWKDWEIRLKIVW